MGPKCAIESICKTIEVWSNESEDSNVKGDPNIAQYIATFRKNMEQCNIQMPSLINDGFSCGLCRMLDTSQQIQAELMPYLLTAYIVNFPKNAFVRRFLANYQDAKISWNEDILLGLTPLKITSDFNQNSQLTVGIGHLYLKDEHTNPRKYKEELDRLADRFRICREKMRFISPYTFPPKTYIVPEYSAASFSRKLKKEHYFEPIDEGRRELVTVYTGFRDKDDLFQIYDCALITDIFIVWYVSIYESFTSNEKSYRPDAYKCICCLLEAIGNYSTFMCEIEQYLHSKSSPSSYRMKIHEKIMLYYKELCLEAVESKNVPNDKS